MIRAAAVPRSAKREGIREARIIRRLVPFFEAAGYDAVPHARFNIAWGSILSDIDLLLIGRPGGAAGRGARQEVVAVEAKSSRDDLRRASAQVGRLLDYADRAYVATDYAPRRFDVGGAGLLVVGRGGGGRVDVVRAAPRAPGWRGKGGIVGAAAAAAAAALPRKCLLRMAEARDMQGASRHAKARLAQCVAGGTDAEALGCELTEVALCGGGGACDAACPAWEFEGARGRR